MRGPHFFVADLGAVRPQRCIGKYDQHFINLRACTVRLDIPASGHSELEITFNIDQSCLIDKYIAVFYYDDSINSQNKSLRYHGVFERAFMRSIDDKYLKFCYYQAILAEDTQDMLGYESLLTQAYQFKSDMCNAYDDERTDMSNDQVNHPSHYTQGGIECIEAIKSSMSPQEYLGYLKGNVMKYLWRYRNKDYPIQDIQKAQWYLNKLEETLKEAEKDNND